MIFIRHRLAAAGLGLTFLTIATLPAQALDLRGLGQVRTLFGVGQEMIEGITRSQREAEARQRRWQAQQRAEARRAKLSSTKAGRAQLAREDRAARLQAQRNQALAVGAFRAIVGSGGFFGGSGGNSRPEYRYEYVPGSSSGGSTPARSSGFYGNCHGGSFYGC